MGLFALVLCGGILLSVVNPALAIWPMIFGLSGIVTLTIVALGLD